MRAHTPLSHKGGITCVRAHTPLSHKGGVEGRIVIGMPFLVLLCLGFEAGSLIALGAFHCS